MKLISSMLVLLSLTACGPRLSKTDLINRLTLSTVAVASQLGHGTGVFLINKGQEIILTNNHVCEGLFSSHNELATIFGALINQEVNATIIDYKGQQHPAKEAQILGKNASSDLCAIYFTAPEYMVPATLALTQPVPSEILVLGYPGSDPLTPSFGYAVAITQDWLNPFDTSTYITAKIFPGNSGSPVVNMEGYLVGLVNEGDPGTSNGRAVSLENIKNFLNSL